MILVLTTPLSLVSNQKMKPVLSEGSLKLVLLNLKAGERLDEHRTDRVLFVQCLEGAPEVVLYHEDDWSSSQSVALQPATLLRIEPLQLHAVSAGESDCLLLLHLIQLPERGDKSGGH